MKKLVSAMESFNDFSQIQNSTYTYESGIISAYLSNIYDVSRDLNNAQWVIFYEMETLYK